MIEKLRMWFIEDCIGQHPAPAARGSCDERHSRCRRQRWRARDRCAATAGRPRRLQRDAAAGPCLRVHHPRAPAPGPGMQGG